MAIIQVISPRGILEISVHEIVPHRHYLMRLEDILQDASEFLDFWKKAKQFGLDGNPTVEVSQPLFDLLATIIGR